MSNEERGYEIWDRFERAFIRDFDTEEQARAFLHEMVRSLSFDAAATILDRFQLVEVTNNGNSTTVLFVGTALMPFVANAPEALEQRELHVDRAYAADPERQAEARAMQRTTLEALEQNEVGRYGPPLPGREGLDSPPPMWTRAGLDMSPKQVRAAEQRHISKIGKLLASKTKRWRKR